MAERLMWRRICQGTDPTTGLTHSETIAKLRRELREYKMALTRKQRQLDRVAAVIIGVEQRCAAVDGPVARTETMITGDDIRQIYKLATRKWKGRARL